MYYVLTLISRINCLLKFIRLYTIRFKFFDVVMSNMQLALTNIASMLALRIMLICFDFIG